MRQTGGMTFLLRLVLPDRPGSLGAVASAIGAAGGDIVSLDVVERGADTAVDDLLVELPTGGLADTLITAAQSVPGVLVESLRPYLGGQDIHRDLELVDHLAADPVHALQLFAELLPGVFRAGWALLVRPGADGGAPEPVLASAGGPDLTGVALPWLPLRSARRIDYAEEWVPARWELLGLEMAAAPVGTGELGAGLTVLVGRPGGPRFRPSEVLRLAHLSGLVATLVRATAGAAVSG